MAILFVNGVRGGNISSATTVASPSMSHSAGNLLVASFRIYPSAITISSVADTAGNTWHQAGTRLVDSFDSTESMYYAYNCLGNAANVVTATLSTAATYRAISVTQFSGVRTATDPLLDAQSGTGTGTAMATATLNATGNVVVVAFAFSISAGLAGGTGFTMTPFSVTGDATLYFADEYRILTVGT